MKSGKIAMKLRNKSGKWSKCMLKENKNKIIKRRHESNNKSDTIKKTEKNNIYYIRKGCKIDTNLFVIGTVAN